MQRTTLFLTLLAAINFISVLVIYDAESVAQGLDANTKDSERVYRTEVDGEGALSEQMIEDCIILKTDIDTSFAEIDKAKNEFDALNKEVTELGAYLKKNMNILLRGSSDDQDIYNKKKDSYNSKLPELDNKLAAYKAMSEPYQQQVDKLNRECQGQQYYEDDYAKMVEKMGRGM